MNDRPHRRNTLPHTLQPIGLNREEAAAFICVSPSKFDQMVADGRMPNAKQIDARRVWSRVAIEKAFAKLPGDDEVEEVDKWNVQPETPAQFQLRKARELTPWERKLLLSLHRRGVPAPPETLEGAGPLSRASLTKRGYITDDGKKLSLTDAGRERAKEASRPWA